MINLNIIKQKLKTLKRIKIGLDENEQLFIKHNLEQWKDNHRKEKLYEILVESCSIASSVIAFSYFSNLLSKKYNAKIAIYDFKRDFLSNKIKKRNLLKIYRSFGAADFIYPRLTTIQKKEKQQLTKTILGQIKNKQDLENLRIDGLRIGDLIYDSHLRAYYVPTVDLNSRKFLKTLKEAIKTFIFWRDYLTNHSVKAIIVSHTVYIPAILVRIAATKNISSYQVNANQIYHMDKSKIRAYNEHFDYPEQFKKLPLEIQKNGLLEAKERINLRFSGEVGVDMPYMTRTAYSTKKLDRVLSYSDKIKILIAAHCFFDAPHPYGINLFPDFYEWLHFLGKISENTDYEWYIKTHPGYLPGNLPIIKSFLKQYGKFQYIPSDTSHLQLIDEGINIALSVYGTIGFEYAALGVPVVYASTCNPCVAYNFNIHPQSIDEYKNILMDLSNIELDVDINKVYEFYFMRFIYNAQNWLYNDYDGFIKEIGGLPNRIKSVCYKKFLSEINEKKHKRIMLSLNQFVESKEYYFQKNHLVNRATEEQSQKN